MPEMQWQRVVAKLLRFSWALFRLGRLFCWHNGVAEEFLVRFGARCQHSEKEAVDRLDFILKFNRESFLRRSLYNAE